ncbi:MAG: dihydrofolate reductase family protein [Saprospiraceae bacterium]
MQHERRLFLFIAASLDGYIARPDGDISWLSSVEVPGEDYGYGNFIDQVDTVILGRKTYEKVQSLGVAFPHQDKNVYVLSSRGGPESGSLRFYKGPVAQLVAEIRTQAGKHLFCDGGAEVIRQLLQAGLVDDIILSTIPVLLGEGIRLFQGGLPELPLQLVAIKSFDSGLVQAHYRKAGK